MVCREFCRREGRGISTELAPIRLTVGSTGVNMELSAVGERVFAAESIIKRRIRKVRREAVLFCYPRIQRYHHSNSTVASVS